MTTPYQTGSYCQACGSMMPADAWFCPNCRAQVSLEVPSYQAPQHSQYPQTQPAYGMARCHGCGNAVHAHAHSCPHCGAPQRAAYANQKNKTTAALLAIFLGGFGAHKFYLNQIGLGILYLVFCWAIVPWLIAFIECIIFFVMPEEEFAAKYNHG
jgi:TM2 domain-containing membrane protein YozV/RNA polymerase subunit RPABC4/transcription elongation factor Spt4